MIANVAEPIRMKLPVGVLGKWTVNKELHLPPPWNHIILKAIEGLYCITDYFSLLPCQLNSILNEFVSQN